MAEVETNWDELDDDAFMAALDEAANSPVEENLEDTDQNDTSKSDDHSDTETNIDDDDHDMDTEEDGFEEDDVNSEENSHAEEDINPDDTPGSNEENETSAENEDEESDDSELAADENKQDKELDYKSEYAKILEEKQKLEDFYNKVTGEFVANGRKMKGFDDPEKIIKAQQMAAGYSEKMAAFKAYRPFMNALKEKGLLDNPDKFNLAMNILDGDKEAIKKMIKETEIDPQELDLEDINYSPKNEIASDIEIALDDVMENAAQYGVQDTVREIISKEWDDDSVIELLQDPKNSADLIDHLTSGVFDVVQDKILEKRRIDVNGVYTNKPMIDQYREAASELEQEFIMELQRQGRIDANGNIIEPQQNTDAPAEQGWIQDPNLNADTEQQEAYKAKVEKQAAKTNEARRKATSLSRKKRSTKKIRQEVDPLSLDDDKFMEFIDSIAYQQ